MIEIVVPIRRWPHGEGLAYPEYATDDAAGVDLSAALGEDETIVVRPGEIVRIPTGIGLAIPQGFEGQVRPRSGLAFRHGLTLVNSPGTIDADYRGEIQVILSTLKSEPFEITRGMRIAQLVFCPVARANFEVTESLDATRRGAGGFGHTGIEGAASTD